MFTYDRNGRLIETTEYSNEDYYTDIATGYSYDDNGRVTSVKYTVHNLAGNARDTTVRHHYTYSDSGRLQSYVVHGNKSYTASYTYDCYDRPISVIGNTMTSYISRITYDYRSTSDHIPTEQEARRLISARRYI